MRASALTGALLGAMALSLGAGGCAGNGGAGDGLLLLGGEVVDGSGAPARRADVLVRGGRIAEVGRLDGARAARVLDVSGLVVAPGFIDMHSHADLILLAGREQQERLLGAKMRQGVTTVIVGNCGLGAAPANEEAAAILADVNGWMTPARVEGGAMSVADYLGRIERQGVVLNVGTLVPHGPVRISAFGPAAGHPSADELSRMRALVRAGLAEGAFGLSVGLIYPPGMYTDTDELAALAAEVAAAGRLFAAHVRGSSETLLRATSELVEIARRSGARVHHSHLEAVGEPYWAHAEDVLAMEDAARGAGLTVTHDVFPYARAATMMSAVFPPWSLDGGIPALLARLDDPLERQRIRDDIATQRPEWPPWRPGGWPHNLVGAVGWDGIVVASVGSTASQEMVGQSLEELGEARGEDPFDVVANLMRDEEGQVGQLVLEISGRSEDSEALQQILRHPAGAVVSDAEDFGRGRPHPAHAGAFARALRLARAPGGLTLEETVRRMTAVPASIVGLEERGHVAPGAVADLTVFDPAAVTDEATWESPRRPARGVAYVILGGRVVVDEGRLVGGSVGRVLRAATDAADDARRDAAAR